MKKISNIEIPENSGDFKLLSRKIVNLLLENQERLPFIKGLVPYYGFKQLQLHYNREPRYDGKENTKFPFFHLVYLIIFFKEY